MSDHGRKWIVKGGDGKISGPYVTSQVLTKIEFGDFSGDEMIAIHPGGNWIPISTAPEFYDKLLDALASEADQLRKSTSSRSAKPGARTPPVDNDSDNDEETFFEQKPRGRVVRENPKLEIDEPASAQPPPQAPKLEKAKASDRKDVIELIDVKKLKTKLRAKSARTPLMLIATAVALVILAFLFQPSSSSGKIRLLAPRKGQPAITENEVKEKIGRGLFNFQKDTFATYVKAQNDFVNAVEGAPLNQIGYGNLCLAYRELWPFTTQDSKDLSVINEVTQTAKRIDPGGFSGALCEITYLIAANRYAEARGLTDTWIVVQSSSAVLYELTAEFLRSEGRAVETVGYLEKARVLWPQWLKPYVQEAKARAELKQFPAAMQLLSVTLKANPQHQAARAETGFLEFKQGQSEKAFELIKSAIDSGDRLPRQTEYNAYVLLAQLYERKNSAGKALTYAKKAFAMNSGDPFVREMVARLGGKEALETTGQGSERMYRGDELVRVGDCVSAQAEYRAAFEDDKKNATAALKAAKCLWQLNQTDDAIQWLNKAIKADSKLVVSYTTLADYYSQRFDYLSAVSTLRKIQQLSPKSFEVYRGFAQVELRRNNFKGAADFAKRAAEIYEADAETYIVMAAAQAGMGKFPDAQRFAQRAIELDQSNIEAQSLYAKILVDLQGVQPALVYVDGLINAYPQVVDYRVIKGEILSGTDRQSEAITVLREARSLDQANKRAVLALGKALQAQGQNQDALKNFLEAAEMDPSDANPLFQAGLLYSEDTRTLPDAIRMFERVLKTNPKFPRGHVQLGYAQLKKGNAADAIKEAQLERGINPELPDAYILAAEAFYALRQYSSCAAEYQLAVGKQQGNTLLYVKMARCYRLSGSVDSALSLLNQAKDRENGNPEIYKELGATFHVKGMRDEAIAAYGQYLGLAPMATDRAVIQGYIDRIEQGDMTFDDKD